MSAPGVANAADSLLSQGKVTSASSIENAGTPAANATDGNTGTRWSSAFADPQWLQVDLGANANISQVSLNWEAAYAKTFTIQTSPTGTGNWTDITPVTSGQAGVQTLTVSGSGRFVRMNGLTRATGYGYSLFEFQVYGAFG
ncbi:MAG: discoidin domain-containing protein, partial [Actinomycetota bacterium]|nr:discoidin domain-containing protein [Actinomycetota bacterium]